MISLSDNQKIGVGLTTLGVVFLSLGILFFFDAGLLIIGNLLFLTGLVLTIGIMQTLQLFFSDKQLIPSFLFICGLILTFLKGPLLGMILQSFGFFFLFKQFITNYEYTLRVMQSVPILSTILKSPIFANLSELLSGDGRNQHV